MRSNDRRVVYPPWSEIWRVVAKLAWLHALVCSPSPPTQFPVVYGGIGFLSCPPIRGVTSPGGGGAWKWGSALGGFPSKHSQRYARTTGQHLLRTAWKLVVCQGVKCLP